jgi:hypothetical protein
MPSPPLPLTLYLICGSDTLLQMSATSHRIHALLSTLSFWRVRWSTKTNLRLHKDMMVPMRTLVKDFVQIDMWLSELLTNPKRIVISAKSTSPKAAKNFVAFAEPSPRSLAPSEGARIRLDAALFGNEIRIQLMTIDGEHRSKKVTRHVNPGDLGTWMVQWLALGMKLMLIECCIAWKGD